MSYSGGGQYIYVWKTDPSWSNTCRKLTVTLKDGSSQVAYFKFR
ncbi:PxKF domain-containing protein [Deinococcus sp. KSM4-11]|nr:PxKF domain-containing protein [Deinococcus sp. KSM4-11]